MTPPEAATFLALQPRTLTVWRVEGKGPRYVKVGGRIVRYRREDLERWLQQHVVTKRSA